MKRSQLAWWENLTLAFSMWLSVLLDSLRPPAGRPPAGTTVRRERGPLAGRRAD